MIFPDRNCFRSSVIGNTQIYVQEPVEAKEPDIKLLLLMSSEAKGQPLCSVTARPISSWVNLLQLPFPVR